ncbi:hypothetical protein HPB48_010219 [Haemaphysalis longicornis]|uniref:Cuticle protein n=1 Tax=Haemaphysalis longicornis TaxID=44386 RepID=A0A9J6GB55_HAELO|nr:hypothetical protein HPB48_010219 [Haemaphysalis longicornis]
MEDHGNYEFGFNIEGLSWDQFQRESGDALGRKVGAYGFRDVDGRLRLVEYVADELGFRVKVQTNEPGTRGSTAPSAVVDSTSTPSMDIKDTTVPPSSVVSESALKTIMSPPPARLLRRLSPLPPLMPRSLDAYSSAKLPAASEPDVKMVSSPALNAESQQQPQKQASSLKLPPSHSLAEKFESPLLPTGTVKMDAHPALRRYDPNIFQLGRPVHLGQAVPSPYYQHEQYRPHTLVGPSPIGPPYGTTPQRRNNAARGAALVPKEVNGKIVTQVALIRADGTLSTEEPFARQVNYPHQQQQPPQQRPPEPQYNRPLLQLPGPRSLYSNPQQATPHVGNIFPINTVHPAGLGFPAEPLPLYGNGGYFGHTGPLAPNRQQHFPPALPGYQRLPDGLTVNYFIANTLPVTGRPVSVAAPAVQPQPLLPQRPRVIDPAYLSQRADTLGIPPTPQPGSQGAPIFYGQRIHPPAQVRHSGGLSLQQQDPYTAPQVTSGLQEAFLLPVPRKIHLPRQPNYSGQLPPLYGTGAE